MIPDPDARQALEDAAARLLEPVEGLADGDLLALASRLVWNRPLAVYPGWKFDADWDNPDFAFRLRRRIWQICLDRPVRDRVEYRWIEGIRLNLSLRNDLSKQLFIAGTVDPNEFAWLDKILAPGMCVVDAGANEGIYALFAAVRVGRTGRVAAFEPSARERAALEPNVALNGLSQVRVLPFALGDWNGEIRMELASEPHAGQNVVGGKGGEGVRQRTLDSMMDELGFARLDLIKVDIEGSESRFVAGARGTIQRFRPVMLIEFFDALLRDQGSSVGELAQMIREMDYVLYEFDPETGLPREMPRVVPDSFSHNLVAYPRERPLSGSVFSAGVFSAVPRIS